MSDEIVFPSVIGNLPEPVRHSEKGSAASFESEGVDGRLAEACSEFESYFIQHLFKQMRATIPKSDLFGDRKSEEMYTSILDLELARDLAGKGGIGLSAMLSRRLTETGNLKLETGSSKLETGSSKLETRNRKPEAGDRKPST